MRQRCKLCPTSNRTNLNGWHGDRHVKVLSIVDGFHHGNAVRSIHILGWVLVDSDVEQRRRPMVTLMLDPTRARSTTGSKSKTLTRFKPWDFRSCTSLYVDKPPVLGLGFA
ncbi:hypothetical protein COP2_012891 [Malus domestica]